MILPIGTSVFLSILFIFSPPFIRRIKCPFFPFIINKPLINLDPSKFCILLYFYWTLWFIIADSVTVSFSWGFSTFYFVTFDNVDTSDFFLYSILKTGLIPHSIIEITLYSYFKTTKDNDFPPSVFTYFQRLCPGMGQGSPIKAQSINFSPNQNPFWIFWKTR